MGATKPNHRDEAAELLIAAARRQRNVQHTGEARLARLLHDDYQWETSRICEALDVTEAELATMLDPFTDAL